MKFGFAGDAIEGYLDAIISYPITSNLFKMFEVQNSDVDALPAPFSLAQQWVGIL
jgi:hypothetical protein